MGIYDRAITQHINQGLKFEKDSNMFIKNDFPILEFDDNPTAKLNPIEYRMYFMLLSM